MNITDSTKNRWLIVSVVLTVFAMLYMVIGYYVEAQNGMNIIGSRLDQMIPFIPITVWFYLGAYIFILLFGTIKVITSDLFFDGLKIIGVASAINFVILTLFPFEYPRPIMDDVGYVISSSYAVIEFDWDNLSPLIAKMLYGFDPPSCTFPSFHMTLSTCYTFLVWRLNKKLGILFSVLVGGLFVVILTTKQHFIVDGMAGIITAWIGSKFAFKEKTSVN